MRILSFTVFLICMFIHLNAQRESDFHAWANTPPMGWNSWDCFGPTVVEDEVKANADYMAEHLLAFGWEYIVVDIRWYVSNDKAHGYNQTDPDYSIDRYGRLQPAENRFPSAADGKGFKPLADYIHAKGLKFGIHIMRGVPVIAVQRKLPVKGTNLTAADIYSEKDQCRWLRDMYTIVPGKAGAQEYYNSLFELYASWGVDFVKVDDLSSPIYFEKEVEMIRKAIDRCGRSIVLSTSPGETPVDHAAHVQSHVNMWRTVGDFWDSWLQLKEHFNVFERWNTWRKPGAWPDGDMLPLGHIGIRAERGVDRFSAFTKDEQRTLMTLWAMFRSPLMFGGHLPDNDPYTLSLLTNKELLYILNHSVNNREWFRTDSSAAWIADDPATGDKFLAIFNIADQPLVIESRARWKSPGIDRSNPVDQLSLDIRGYKKLYLVVTDGGDNIDWDHADWVDAFLYRGKDSVSLSSLPWKMAVAGWNHPLVDSAVSGNPLIINGRKYAHGIGTHSNSIIAYDLPAAFDRFSAAVGLDHEGAVQNTGATMQFMVFDQSPSGPMPPEEQIFHIDLSGLGFQGPLDVMDCWSGSVLENVTGEIIGNIKRHGCVLFRISSRVSSITTLNHIKNE